jgi:predicted enzyme related to lactoylglutathione lyase
MGERTSYPAGTFSWAELVTSDADAAKAFYAQVLGWEYDDQPIPDEAGGGVYTMAKRDGKNVAALFASGDQPPHWNCYVTVASADETAGKASELGANLMAEPFDVMDVGRMAVFADPAGAALCIWEARAHIGAELVNAPGALTWIDLITPDAAAAERFYGALFGWTFSEIPDAGGYRVIRNSERSNGGMMQRDDMPAAWIPYFGHEDVDRLATELGGVGGRPLGDVVRMPQGSILPVMDPQGAVFSVWTGEYED